MERGVMGRLLSNITPTITGCPDRSCKGPLVALDHSSQVMLIPQGPQGDPSQETLTQWLFNSVALQLRLEPGRLPSLLTWLSGLKVCPVFLP